MIRQVTFDTKELLARIEFPGIPKWRMKVMTEYIDILIRDDPLEHFKLMKHTDFVVSRLTVANRPKGETLYRIVAKHDDARQKTPLVCKMHEWEDREWTVEVIGFTLDLESKYVEVIEEYHPVINHVVKALVKVGQNALITSSLLTKDVLEQIAKEDQIEKDEEVARRLNHQEEKYDVYRQELIKAEKLFCESDQTRWSEDYDTFLRMVSTQMKTFEGLVTTYFVSNRMDGRSGDYTKSVRVYYVTSDGVYKEDIELRVIGGTMTTSRLAARLIHRHTKIDESLAIRYCKRPRWYVNQPALYQEDCVDVEAFFRNM